MDCRERRLRREQILKEYKKGASVRELSIRHGLSISYLRGKVLKVAGHRECCPERQCTTTKFQFTDAEKAQHDREAHIKFLKWKSEHLRTCADFSAGECCPECHETDELISRVKGQTEFILCCSKVKANYRETGYLTPLAFGRPKHF